MFRYFVPRLCVYVKIAYLKPLRGKRDQAGGGRRGGGEERGKERVTLSVRKVLFSLTLPLFPQPQLFLILPLLFLLSIHLSLCISHSSPHFFWISVSSFSPLLQRPYLSLLLIFTKYFLCLTIPFHNLDTFSFCFYPIPSFYSVLPFTFFGYMAGWGILYMF